MTPPQNQLPTRQLGKDGPQVTALGWGAMGLSGVYGAPLPDSERFALLDHIYASGVTNWDSSDIYADSEDLLGKWFAQNPGKREHVFLATKFAVSFTPDRQLVIQSDPEYVKQACVRSLKRLGIDTIDLYYCHRLDMVTPIEKTVQAMAELKKEGKIRYLGLSECSAESLRRACKVHHISAVQIEYSPWTLDIEDPRIGLLNACRELGVSVIAYSPLGRGFLTGRYKSPDDFAPDDFRRISPRFSAENFPKNLAVVRSLQELAKEKGVDVASLTLAWLMAQGDDIIPIPGTTSRKNFDTNLEALNVKLTPEENAKIREVVNSAEVAGDRYHPGMMISLFADTPPLQ